jgi:hypothetical protein
MDHGSMGTRLAIMKASLRRAARFAYWEALCIFTPISRKLGQELYMLIKSS